MSYLDSDTSVSLVAGAFSSYLKPSEEIVFIRGAISKYLSSLAQHAGTEDDEGRFDPSKLVPDHVKGAHREYVESLKASSIARKNYEELLILETSDSRLLKKPDCADSLIYNYLNILELHQSNNKLETIKRYTTEARSAAQDETVVEMPATRNEDYSTIGLQSTWDVIELIHSSKTLIRNLELAIIQAQYQLEQEKAYLDRLSNGKMQSVVTVDSAQIQALSATRDELTKWLEETLGECSNDSTADFSSKHADAEARNAAKRRVEQSYEHYIDARRKALLTTATLRSPSEKMKVEPSDMLKVPPKQVLLIETHPIIPYLERDSLPQGYLQNEIVQQNTYVTGQVQADRTKTESSIDKLGSESQLLSSYPLPIGSEQSARSHTTSGRSPYYQREDDNISHWTEVWSFASQSANAVSGDTIKSHSEDGLQSLVGANTNITDLRYLESSLKKTKI